MKINNIQGVNSVYNNHKKIASQPANFSNYMQEGNMEISQRGREFAFAIEKLKSIPDIREDKVMKIKNEIQRGIYKVDSQKLARSILLGEFNE